MKTKLKKQYLRDNGFICPYCGDKNLKSGVFNLNMLSYLIGREVKCSRCGETWTDIYKLADVE